MILSFFSDPLGSIMGDRDDNDDDEDQFEQVGEGKRSPVRDPGTSPARDDNDDDENTDEASFLKDPLGSIGFQETEDEKRTGGAGSRRQPTTDEEAREALEDLRRKAGKASFLKDPLGSVGSSVDIALEQVGIDLFEQDELCEGLIGDVVETGERAAVHKDVASIMREGGETQIASTYESISRDEKQHAQSLINVAEQLGCDVPQDIKNAVSDI